MASYSRFSDENYKNWLRTTMSLQLLRSSLNGFVEKETETYHSSLRERLGNEECKERCKINPKVKTIPQVCKTCVPWRDEIKKNHGGGTIYWDNCEPNKWSSDKWEVAKVYMTRGNNKHNRIEQFDISAILSFMTFCKHFKRFVKTKIIEEVSHVRNQMMHSPDMKVTKDDMMMHWGKILTFVKNLQDHVPELKMLEKELEQLQTAELGIILEGQDPSVAKLKENVETLQSVQRMLDLEQQVLKEKIELLAHHLEDDKQTVENGELEGIKAFLEQNKDLLEQLGPQVQKLEEVQTKVDLHEEQLNVLTEKVGNLEKKQSEPVLSADLVKYKSHILELAAKHRWKETNFSEICHPRGYIGKLVVNGHTFEGTQVHPSKIAAHQEVAKLALEQQDVLLSNGSPCVSSTDQSDVSKNTAAAYFSSVTLHLTIEVEEHCEEKEEAIESAYRGLTSMFGIDVPATGESYKSKVQQYFSESGFAQPKECLDVVSDGMARCKLKLSGPFTFHGQGSTRRKHAEQQAAKVALHKLSRVLGVQELSGENFKGILKEHMEAKGWKPPEYKEIPYIPDDKSASSSQHNLPTEVPDKLQDKVIDQLAVPATPNEAPPPTQASKMVPLASNQFYAEVKVPVKAEVTESQAGTQEGAAEAAYRSLADALALGALPRGRAKQLVLDFFTRAGCQPPAEHHAEAEGGKFACRLEICGDFTFQNQEGMSRKQQAEQQAAKEALSRLSGLLGWPHSDAKGNFKGLLQELLAKQNRQPTYQVLQGRGAAVISNIIADDLSPESNNAGGPACQDTLPISDVVSVAMPSAESSHWPSPPQKQAKIECTEIEKMLRQFGVYTSPENLDVSSEQTLVCNVKINFKDHTFRNKDGHVSKNDAKRKIYLKLAKSLGICNSSTEESQAVALVKTYFIHCNFDPPSEDYKEEAGKFVCLVNVSSCCFSYEGRGSSEEAARKEASRQAFSQLAPLLGYETTVSTSSSVDAEQQLKLLIKDAGQCDPVFQQPSTQQKAFVRLILNNFSLESRDQNKKAARADLSTRILGLLRQDDTEVSSSVSVRNQLDDWFKKRGISQPVFEDTNNGARATFSATLTFSHPDWENSWMDAVTKLIDVMKVRLGHLAEMATN